MPSIQAEYLGKAAFFSGVLKIVLTTLKLYFFDKKGVPEMGTDICSICMENYRKLLVLCAFGHLSFVSEISFLYKVHFARL